MREPRKSSICANAKRTGGLPGVVDGHVGFHLEAVGVGDRSEPRRRTEQAAARRKHELAPGGVVARIDGAQHQRARRRG